MQNISISYLLNLALKRIWVLVLAAVVFAASAFAYSKLVLVPTYASTATILINNGGIIFQEDKDTYNTGEEETNKVSSYDFSASVVLAKNVVELLKSPNKYIKLAERLGDGSSYASLQSRASIVIRNTDTVFVDITFTSVNGDQAVRLANAFAELACEEIPNDIRNAKASLVTNALTYRLVSPNVTKNTAIFAVIGLLAAYAVVFIIDMADKSVRGEDEFVETYDIPLIGSVPDFESIGAAMNNKYGYGYSSKGGYFGGKY